jgi:DNA mismatch repair protein MSH4
MQTQRCFAVNPSVDPLLDVARQTYADVTSDIHDTANKYQQVYPSFNIRLVHNSKRGYHLMMKTSEEVNTQAFILVSTKGGSIFFSTEELESLNQKCNEAVRHLTNRILNCRSFFTQHHHRIVQVNEIYILTGRVLEELVAKLRPYIGILNSLADSLSLLDLLQSFASMVTLSNGTLTRPQFNSAGAIAIEKGRHPLETMVTSEQFIPNDCFLTEECCMKILHGPNMSGKSTYLRQVALLTIMAHTGSFVPAARCSFGNIDRIFTRIGTSGNAKHTCSCNVCHVSVLSYTHSLLQMTWKQMPAPLCLKWLRFKISCRIALANHSL